MPDVSISSSQISTVSSVQSCLWSLAVCHTWDRKLQSIGPQGCSGLFISRDRVTSEYTN